MRDFVLKTHRISLPALLVAVAWGCLACAVARPQPPAAPAPDVAPTASEKRVVEPGTVHRPADQADKAEQPDLGDQVERDEGGASAEEAKDLDEEPRAVRRRRARRRVGQERRQAPSEKEGTPLEPASEASGPGADVVDLRSTSAQSGGWAYERATRRARDAREAIMQGAVAMRALGEQNVVCGSRCEVAEGICASRDIICEVAGQYEQDLRFQSDCEWATRECEQARLICSRCDVGDIP